MEAFLAAKTCPSPTIIFKRTENIWKPDNECKLQDIRVFSFSSIHAVTARMKWARFSALHRHLFKLNGKPQLRCHPVLSSPQPAPSSRRHIIVSTGASLLPTLTINYGLTPSVVWAKEKSNGQEEEDSGIIGTVKSLFDPNEKTKSGKVLPKAYLKSARGVVKTLRESLKEDPQDITKFRRTADAAKESIREYLSSWRGQHTVVQEESYVVLEKAIRSLASFYSKAGPSAPLPEEVKSEVLDDLNTAEGFL